MWPRKSRSVLDISDSERALKTSRNDLKAVQDRESKIDRVTKEMLKIRERNHFAEQINGVLINKRRTGLYDT